MNIKQNNFFKKSLLSLAVAGAMSSSFIASASNESKDELETITVTATRSPMDIADSLASVVVITRADIDRIQPKSVLDMLSTVAGLDISTVGGRGQASSIYMRGANSDHTLVLLNGVRISSASLGSTNVQNIAPELVERIEIVKGPRAALWGSDAIGGVIQIFTRKLNNGEHYVSANVGSEGYSMLNGGIGIEHGDGFTSLSVEHEEADGFDAKDDGETDDDGFSFDSFSINGQQKINQALSLNWLAQVDHGDTEYDSSFGANESEINNHVWLLGSNYNWQMGSANNTTKFSISQNRTSNIGHGNGTSKADGSKFDSRRNQYSLINSSELSSQWQLNLGADFYQEELRGDAEYNKTKRDTTGVFAHTMFNDDKLSYELAARYDDVEDIDAETTFNTSVGYQVTPSTQLSVSAGTGFKAPTFNDLYYPLNWGYVGNENLVSETSKSYEVSVKSQFEKLSIAFNIYQTDIEDLIDWNGTDKDDNVTPVNVNDVEIKGAELGVNYQGLGGTHQFNASYIEAEDALKGTQLGRRAKEHLSYQFDISVDQADLYAEIKYKGKRYDYLYGGEVVTLSSYSLVNLGVSYPISDNIKIQAKVNNAFDEKYQTSSAYFTQERVAYFGITYQN
jgi:vitamin B12 transporter